MTLRQMRHSVVGGLALEETGQDACWGNVRRSRGLCMLESQSLIPVPLASQISPWTAGVECLATPRQSR